MTVSTEMAVNAERIDFTSKINGKDYRLFLSVPSGEPPAAGWPVAYLIDGNLHFGIAVDTMRIQACWPETRNAVIVGIGYPTDSVQQALAVRNHDLTPAIPQSAIDGHWLARMAQSADGFGGQPAYLQMIEEEVKPLVASRVAIDPADQTLMGHSLGGLTTLTALLTTPERFANYVAISPSIWFNHAALRAFYDPFLARFAEGDLKLRLFLSTGEYEEHLPLFPPYPKSRPMPVDEAGFTEMMLDCRMVSLPNELSAKLQPIVGDRFAFKYVVHKDEDHRSVVPAGIAGGIYFSFYRPE